MRLHDTKTGRVEDFAPADGRTVKMYVCGPTVYAEPHLGHARSTVVYDTLRRRFGQHGWRVKHVMNFTDTADSIAHVASLEKATIRATASKYAKAYVRTMDQLGWLRPTTFTWASEFVPDVIKDIERLQQLGLAYEESGTLFLDTVKGAPLGLVSRLKFEEVTAGEPPHTGRRNPSDFVLWRNSHDFGECWVAPWSCGRSGWHNQCSAMALRTLGPTLDLHGGGIDLAFPHHDSEAAVAQALTGQPLARTWVHHGHVTVWKEKMSKSRGNFVLAREALRRHGRDAVRLFLLSAPYRAPLDYDAKAMRGWARLGRDLRDASRRARGTARPSDAWDGWLADFGAALDDDLDTPRALAMLPDLARSVRSEAIPRDRAALARALRTARDALGLGATRKR